MAARRHIEGRLGGVTQKDRHDHGDVRQVSAAGIGIVQGEAVAGLEGRMPVPHGPDTGAHRAQMHRHVRRICHKAAVRVE